MKKNITASVRFLLLSFSLFCVGFSAAAQEVAAEALPIPALSGEEQFTRYVLFVFLGLLVLVLLFFINTINSLLKAVIEMQFTQAEKQSPEVAAKLAQIANRPSAWKKLMDKLTDIKPIEKENDILLDHDYDGIRELDNHLPPWWKWGFYISIVASFLYIINYHITPIWGDGLLQQAEFEAENIQAELSIAEYRKKAVDLVDENNVVLLTDAASIDKGKTKFVEFCSACHGEMGQGGIGPNLTDQFWLHGGDVKSVFTTIKYGVLDKGMIAWKDEIKPGEMQALASYILSLQGSNPAGAKEPQGELYVPATDSLQTDNVQNIVPVTSTAKL